MADEPVTIRTIPCDKGGFCEFTVARNDDMHCAKCGMSARFALEHVVDDPPDDQSFPRCDDK